jgi:hypothetical protein
MDPSDIFRLPAFEARFVAGGVGGSVVRAGSWDPFTVDETEQGFSE